MTRSMTGYGKAEVMGGEGKYAVEIRSVNHRSGEVSVKLPRQMLALEGIQQAPSGHRLERSGTPGLDPLPEGCAHNG